MRSKLGIGVMGIVVAFLLATNPVVVNAAGQITSKQIKNETIKSKDIKNSQIKGIDVRDDTLTGSDVSETSLGVVPDATNLNGLAASTYLTNATSFNLTMAAPSGAKVWPIALPAGQYLVNWQASMTALGATGDIICGLFSAGDYAAVHQVDVDGSAIVAFSGGGSVTVTGPTQWSFFCTSAGAGNFSMTGPEGLEVSFQKLSSNSVTPVAARPGPDAGRPGLN